MRSNSHLPWMLTIQLIALCAAWSNCQVISQDKSEPARTNSQKKIEELAGNEEVAEILRSRPGRGVMADDSKPTAPEQAIQTFRVRDGLSIELIASEPKVSQPLFLSWDSAGRLWVVQYRQYQYPAGLKVVRFDQHLRAVFDKTPSPPPNHVQGADVISVLEDTNKDGTLDLQRDVITGLNIATSVAIGQGGIWVMNPPYLLFYSDKDQDCIPDGDPEVHLSGFGIQDTHSVANSLMFGPDGWLYGANGSTTGGNVVSAATPSTEFEGQCIWRYDPRTRVFEVFAEGGGNTFSLDIDAGGRVFSGTNGGATRGWYYPQGSYSQKNWGKHGPLTNPFAFGYFNAMKFQGDDRRFPQAFLIYDGGLLGPDFEGSVIAPNSMCNLVWHSRRYRDGSTFRTVDEPNLVESSDRWFRPVYSGVGPDGGVYLADWYDTRLSHVSPVDDWHKESGRIYRIAPVRVDSAADTTSAASTNSVVSGTRQRLHDPVDLTKLDLDQLIACFSHPNKWVRQRAALEIGWRGDRLCVAKLIEQIQTHGSLEALWAISNLQALDSKLAVELLKHSNPDIRRWTARLLGDRREGHEALAAMAKQEPDVDVRSQLAATAKRIPTQFALPVIASLLQHDDSADPHVPLMIWWALEAHTANFDALTAWLKQPELWQTKVMQNVLAERLMQRYAATGTIEGINRCAQLLDFAADAKVRDTMIGGLNKAFQGRSLPPNLPKSIQQALQTYRDSRGSDGVVLAAKQGDQDSLKKLVGWLRNTKIDLGTRIEVVGVFGQQNYPAAIEPLLVLATGRAGDDPSLQRVALQALANYDGESIGKQIVAAFDANISEEHNLRETASRTLATRPSWALLLLQEINGWRIQKKDIPADVIVQLRSHTVPEVVAEVEKAFGKAAEVNSPEQAEEIQRLQKLLQDTFSRAKNDPIKSSEHPAIVAGEKLFADRCGKCHQLFGKGESIGPKLDSYDRTNAQFWLTAIVAPSAEIREGYQMYQVLTDDGRVLTGMIASQDLNSVSLRKADGSLVTISNDQVEQMQAMKSSLMPEGLLKELNQTQLEQLFSYLTQ